MSTRRLSDQEPVVDAASRPRGGPGKPAHSLLDLQRSAGNAAVAGLVGRAAVQRFAQGQDDSDVDDGGGGGGGDLPVPGRPQGLWVKMEGKLADEQSLQDLANGDTELLYTPGAFTIGRTSPGSSGQ